MLVCYTVRNMDGSRNRHARTLFDGIAEQYDLPAELFSFFQYGRWRRYLVSRLNVGPEDAVMDLCTGTAGVAMQVFRTFGSRVVAVDFSTAMLLEARRKIRGAGLEKDISLILGGAECLPFPNARFDAVCVTYLLRYVDGPQATLREIVRIIKPGGQLAYLEFGVPEHVIARSLWYAYTRGILPLAARPLSHGWRRVGAFLGASIARFYQAYSVERMGQMWLDVGITDVQVKRLSLGSAVVMWGTKASADADLGRSRRRGGSEAWEGDR